MGSPRWRPGVSRRNVLRGLAGGVATAPWLAGCGGGNGGEDADATGRAPGSAAMFAHGVASGDPMADRVILWTHVTPPADEPVAVTWRVSRSPDMSGPIAEGQAMATAERDYTVKIDATGLAPDTTYYYRFEAMGNRSRIGRTRTLPVGATDRLRFAVVSCSSLPHGFFNVYRRIAERRDLNTVLHLGDYIYEYGNATGQYGANVQAGGRTYRPDNEIVTLADYRTRHAQYKQDPDLQELHAQHSMIAIWDDHETANNSFTRGAGNHQTAAEGPWPMRRSVALRAYYEWMPIRVTDPADRRVAYRQFRFGDLAEVNMLETRLVARSGQASIANASDINAGSRKLLGDTQFDWLRERLADSRARWRLLGNQTMFGQLRLAGLPELMKLPLTGVNDLLGQLPLVGTGGAVVNADQWDGYRAARQRVFDLMEDTGNVVVLTGDIHTSWAMNLQRDPFPITGPLLNGPPLGVEFVTPSVTSPGLPELQPATGLIRSQNPHIQYIDTARHGYVLLDVDHERVQAEWWHVDDIRMPSDGERLDAVFTATDGTNELSEGGGASEPATDAPALAPV